MIQDFVTAIKAASKEALMTLGVGTVSPGVSFAKKEEDASYDISSVVCFAGDYVGVCIVKMTEGLALKITGTMMGSEYTALNADVKDAIGEISNLVAGGARTQLNPKGFAFNITTPNVIIGKGHRTRVPSDLNLQVIPFFFANQKMCVEVGVKQK